MVSRAAHAVVHAFRAWCDERYYRAIQKPAMPSSGQLALKRWLDSR
jgi:hypothetical protein